MFFKSRKTKNTKKIIVQNKHIVLNDFLYEYQLRFNPRSKSIRIAISSHGDLNVSVPIRTPISLIEKFIILKKDWIIENIKKAQIHVGENNFGNLNRQDRKKASKNEYEKYKNQALKIATEKTEKWNLHYKFKYNKISIKNQKTRWGSCSRRGNLNFSYKIALLPDYLADYLVVHELCHLNEFNHSHRFWALVEQTIPDYKRVRGDLKSWGK